MYVLLSVALGFAALMLSVTYITFHMTFLSVRKKHFTLYHGLDGELNEKKEKSRQLIERMVAIPYEDVEIKSRDGLLLHARYYHAADDAPLAIQFHGYKSISVRDFSGGAYECISRSHNLLLVDQRAHGKSEGRVISFGVRERFDCLDWIDWSVNRFGCNVRIILYGISMGAATVLMASSLPMPKNVLGIVADCPYSSPAEIIKKVAAEKGFPPKIFYPFIKLGARIFGRFNLEAASAIQSVQNTDIPILLIHGDGDSFVPCEMSDRIAALGKTVTYLKVKDATHGLSYIYDYESYMKYLNEFLNNILSDERKKHNEN